MAEHERVFTPITCAVEPAMSSHPCGTGKVAFQDRWLLIGGSFVYEV